MNSIMSSYNRNFPGRNDGSPHTLSFLTSPEITVAYSLAGTLDFDPLNDVVPGLGVKLTPPTPQPDLPPKGYIRDTQGYLAPATGDVNVIVDPQSDRLQILTPFEPWNGKDYVDLPLLLKAKGKCTTDHISPAGKWLKYRGHLDNISNNMFSGAINAFDGVRGGITHPLTGEKKVDISKAARDIKASGQKWIVVGDENYGEGSSREHAAMSPRLLGCAAVITRSFARIHQSNLKKQGILPLTFQNPEDYEKIMEGDKLSLLDLAHLAPGQRVKLVAKHANGATDEIWLDQTLNSEQIAWFRAGSALNLLREKSKKSK